MERYSQTLYDMIQERLTRFGYAPGSATDAINWLVKACHPAWTGSCNTIPDHAGAPSICPDYTVQVTIGCPPALVDTGTNWDFLVFQPPDDACGAVIVTGSPGIPFESVGASYDGGADGGAIVQILYTQGLTVVQSPTVGRFPAIFAPPANMPTSICSVFPDAAAAAVRQRYGGVTVVPVASDLFNQGTLYSGQFQRPFARGPSVLKYGGTSPATGQPQTTGYFQCNYFGNVPFSETNMVLMDPGSKAAPYKEGAYVPARFTDPTIDFIPVQNIGQISGYYGYDMAGGGVPNRSAVTSASPWAAPSVWINTAGNNPATSAVPWMLDYITNFPGTGTWYEAYGTAVMPLSVPVVIGRGLANEASITVRAYRGFEYLPMDGSPLMQFSKLATPPAPQVIDMYHAVLHDLPGSAFPASWNELGTLLRGIGSVVKRFLPVVTQAVSAIPHPLARTAASLATAFMRPTASRQVAVEAAPRPRRREAARKVTSAPKAKVRLVLRERAKTPMRRKSRALRE